MKERKAVQVRKERVKRGEEGKRYALAVVEGGETK